MVGIARIFDGARWNSYFRHSIYLKTIESEGEKERLLGLAKKYFGQRILVGLVVIVVTVAHRSCLSHLGPKFIELAFPWISPRIAFVILWLLIAIPPHHE